MLNLLLALGSALGREARRDRRSAPTARPERRPPPRHRSGRTSRVTTTEDELSAERLLASPLVPLRHLVRVEPGTVVFQFLDDGEVLLREPGDLIVPGPNPLRAAVCAVAVATEPVRLVVGVSDLETADGQRLAGVDLDVGVQVQRSALTNTVAHMAHAQRADLGRQLAESVGAALELAVRAAVRSTSSAEVADGRIADVLDAQWLPKSFLGGALLRVGTSTLAIRAGADSEPPAHHVPDHVGNPRPDRTPAGSQPADSPAPSTLVSSTPVSSTPVSSAPASSTPVSTLPASTRPARPTPARPEPADSRSGPHGEPTPRTVRGRALELSVDVRLRRLWRQRLGDPPLGIAGATVGNRSTVVAVVAVPPPAYQTSEVREDFASFFADRLVTLVVIDDPADYADLVDQWSAALDLGSGVTARCTESSDERDLGIALSRAPRGSRWQGVDGSPVVALGRLLPYRRIVVSVPGDQESTEQES